MRIPLGFFAPVLAAIASLLLVACGGGDGGGGGGNLAPVANAGSSQTVAVGSVVTLNGSQSSDPDGDPLTYSWTLTVKPSSSSATLTGATTSGPTFTADQAGTYTASLVVSDGKVSSSASAVNVTASVLNAVPVANAGPAQSVFVPVIVTLDGTGSTDADGDPLAYTWTLTTKPTGSAATLSSTTLAKPTFNADVAGSYVASLVVNDGKASSPASTVTIAGSVANAPPVANAGPAQSVTIPVVVTLDGTGSSDPNGDALSYSWTFSSRPSGSTASLAGPTTSRPTFSPDVAGQYVVSLVVSDGRLSSAPSTVSIIASPGNAAPVAVAGPGQNVATGATVNLDGSGSSDVNNDPLSYAWTLTSKPTDSAAVLTDAATATPTFIADKEGVYVASLIVNDGKVNSVPATVSVTATESKKIGVAYLARNNMTVTLTAFSTQDLGNGYTRYTATYRQENNTSVGIDEGTLKLYFTNADALPQYGFFGTVLPGSAFAVTKTYIFEVLSTSTPLLLQYDGDHFFAADPIPGALQWRFPIQ